ncbi:MAG: hypothetical protein IJL76_00390 [Bacilli bacterium]|nr:hypothetical protein [Bacilli bacterium]
MSKKMRVVLYFVLVIIFALINFYFRPIEGNKLVKKDSPTYVNGLYYSDEYFKNNVLDDQSKELYDTIVQDTLKGKNISNYRCELDDCFTRLSKVNSCIYLDHPELLSYYLMHWKSDGANVTYSIETMSAPKYFFAEKRIEREIDNIKRDTKNMNDREKIIYVYDYVSGHNYDKIFTYMGSNQSIYSFFTGGESVCSGFAKSSQVIFQNIGIKSYLVEGYQHLWNYVEFEGKYYVFDATVGASFRDKKSIYHYEGLGRTTVDQTKGNFQELYPPIETAKLKDVLDV